jgi:hypothetical protein
VRIDWSVNPLDATGQATPPRLVALDVGGELALEGEALRERYDLVLVARSDYRHPVGRFDGSLAGVGRKRGERGVLEHNVARW